MVRFYDNLPVDKVSLSMSAEMRKMTILKVKLFNHEFREKLPQNAPKTVKFLKI